MDISPRCRIDAVSAATGHARQLFAGRIRCDHEVANEHATAGWTFVRITIEPYVRSAAHSPRGCLVTAIAPIILTRDWGRRVYRYSLSPNPVVRHSGFHFIARAILTPSFRSIQRRPPRYALSSIPRCPARPPDASQGYAPDPEERRRACTGGSDELNACYLVKKILGFHAAILEPPWSFEPDDGPSLLRNLRLRTGGKGPRCLQPGDAAVGGSGKGSRSESRGRSRLPSGSPAFAA